MSTVKVRLPASPLGGHWIVSMFLLNAFASLVHHARPLLLCFKPTPRAFLLAVSALKITAIALDFNPSKSLPV